MGVSVSRLTNGEDELGRFGRIDERVDGPRGRAHEAVRWHRLVGLTKLREDERDTAADRLRAVKDDAGREEDVLGAVGGLGRGRGGGRGGQRGSLGGIKWDLGWVGGGGVTLARRRTCGDIEGNGKCR